VDPVHPEIDLLIDALGLTEVVVVCNSGSGMRRLIPAGCLIGLSAATADDLRPGRIVLAASGKLLMGGRVVATDPAGRVQIKSDCGTQAPYWRLRSEMAAGVRFIEIDGRLHPLYPDARSQALHEAIAARSLAVAPGPGRRLVLSGHPADAVRRKFHIWRLRALQRRLRAHIAATTQPLDIDLTRSVSANVVSP
jgi:hypothetical protein